MLDWGAGGILGGHDFFLHGFGGGTISLEKVWGGTIFCLQLRSKKIVSYFSFIATLVSSFVHENILFCFPISRFSGFLTTLTKKVLDLFPVFEEKSLEVCILN